MTRRTLLNTAILTGFGTALLTRPKVAEASLCLPVNSVPSSAIATLIVSNHGHAMALAIDDINDGREKTLDITGASSHPHLVTISKDQFTQLRLGQQIQVTSSTDAGHTHSVQVKIPSRSVKNVVGSNHGHALVLGENQIQVGSDITLDIKGASGHPHSLSLTETDLRELRLGRKIVVTSSVDAGHSHSIEIEFT